MVKEKEKLQSQGFGNWATKDFRSFCNAMERHGRKAKNAIFRDVSSETGKIEEDVEKYYNVFWKRYKEISDWEKIISKIEAGEYRIARAIEIKEALETKVTRHHNPWQTMTIEYGGAANKGKEFSDEEDIFLVNMMHVYGYGNWDKIRMQIRKSHRFAFDWFFKSRTSLQLERRGNTLIKVIERENEEMSGSSGTKKARAKKRERENEETSSTGKRAKSGKAKKK